jgi:hypothetical protein
MGNTHKALVNAEVRRLAVESTGAVIWVASRFSDDTGGGIHWCSLLLKYCTMKCISIWKIWSELIFSKQQTYDTSKLQLCKRSKVPRKSRKFNAKMGKKFMDTAPNSVLKLTFKKNLHLSNLSVVPKNNIHNYLKRLLKYSSLFQLHICVRPELSWCTSK